MATKCRVPKIMFNQIFLQKFGTCLGVQYFALLLSFLRQTDNKTGIKIQNNPYILK